MQQRPILEVCGDISCCGFCGVGVRTIVCEKCENKSVQSERSRLQTGWSGGGGGSGARFQQISTTESLHMLTLPPLLAPPSTHPPSLPPHTINPHTTSHLLQKAHVCQSERLLAQRRTHTPKGRRVRGLLLLRLISSSSRVV